MKRAIILTIYTCLSVALAAKDEFKACKNDNKNDNKNQNWTKRKFKVKFSENGLPHIVYGKNGITGFAQFGSFDVKDVKGVKNVTCDNGQDICPPAQRPFYHFHKTDCTKFQFCVTIPGIQKTKGKTFFKRVFSSKSYIKTDETSRNYTVCFDNNTTRKKFKASLLKVEGSVADTEEKKTKQTKKKVDTARENEERKKTALTLKNIKCQVQCSETNKCLIRGFSGYACENRTKENCQEHENGYFCPSSTIEQKQNAIQTISNPRVRRRQRQRNGEATAKLAFKNVECQQICSEEQQCLLREPSNIHCENLTQEACEQNKSGFINGYFCPPTHLKKKEELVIDSPAKTTVPPQ